MSTSSSSRKRERETSGSHTCDEELLDSAPSPRTRGLRPPNARERDDIVCACRSGDLATLKEYYDVQLIDLSASGAEPLNVASQYGGLDVVKFLIAAGCDVNCGYPLHFAVSGNRLGVVKYLVSIECDKEKKDEDGQTPLFKAMWRNKLILLKYLVSVGCRIAATDNKGRTPLHVAGLNRNENFGGYLILAGDEAKDADGLHLCKGIVELLLAAGCDKEARDVDGRTPLHYMAWRDDEIAFRHCLAAGCDQEAKDVYGRTPLHFCAMGCSPGTAVLLLDAGCDKEVRDNEGRTPLHAACSAGSGSMVKLLLSHKCDTKAVDTFGCTPFFAALVDRRYDVIRVLEGDSAFEKRLTRIRGCSDVDSMVASFFGWGALLLDNGQTCLIRCDDTVTLADGSELDSKMVLVRILELRLSDRISCCRDLMSLSCLLRDGETVTLLDGRVLDNRSCLVEGLNMTECSNSCGEGCRNLILLRLGILLRDPAETIALPAVGSFTAGTFSGQECLAWLIEKRTWQQDVARLYLGVRLGYDESIILCKEVVTKKLCFYRGANAHDLDAMDELLHGHYRLLVTLCDLPICEALKGMCCFQLGLLLLREQHPEAALLFWDSLHLVSSSTAEFYFGVALRTSNDAEFREWFSRDWFVRAIQKEDDELSQRNLSTNIAQEVCCLNPDYPQPSFSAPLSIGS